MKKLIDDKDDKEVAVVLCTGVIALARIISGSNIKSSKDNFLDDCEILSRKYVDRVIKANPTID